jgi:hypothetical protein
VTASIGEKYQKSYWASSDSLFAVSCIKNVKKRYSQSRKLTEGAMWSSNRFLSCPRWSRQIDISLLRFGRRFLPAAASALIHPHLRAISRKTVHEHGLVDFRLQIAKQYHRDCRQGLGAFSFHGQSDASRIRSRKSPSQLSLAFPDLQRLSNPPGKGSSISKC